MGVSIGTRLGPYEILAQLGAGGMGQVYLGQDSKLHRKVAIKLLSPEFACNQDRLRRFIREAEAAAALNHPNVTHIYEVNEVDGLNFITMEYVEGETLRQLIAHWQTQNAGSPRYCHPGGERAIGSTPSRCRAPRH
jgi:serine/threonine-protein kinase